MLSCLKQPKGFYKRLLYLSLPVIAQNLITTSLGFMDTFMVGLLGSDQMSAVTVANVPIFIIQLVVFGLQSGSSILISQYWGKGDRESVNRVIGIGFYVAGGISTLFAPRGSSVSLRTTCISSLWRSRISGSSAFPTFSTRSRRSMSVCSAASKTRSSA